MGEKEINNQVHSSFYSKSTFFIACIVHTDSIVFIQSIPMAKLSNRSSLINSCTAGITDSLLTNYMLTVLLTEAPIVQLLIFPCCCSNQLDLLCCPNRTNQPKIIKIETSCSMGRYMHPPFVCRLHSCVPPSHHTFSNLVILC